MSILSQQSWALEFLIGRYVKTGLKMTFNYGVCIWKRAWKAGKEWWVESNMVRVFNNELDNLSPEEAKKIFHDQFAPEIMFQKDALRHMNDMIVELYNHDDTEKELNTYIDWTFVDTRTGDIYQFDPSSNSALWIYDFRHKKIVHEKIDYTAVYFSSKPLRTKIKEIEKNFQTKLPEIEKQLYPLIQIAEIEKGKISFKDYDDWSKYIRERFLKEVAGPKALHREINADMLDVKFIELLVLPRARKYLAEMITELEKGNKLNLPMFYKQVKAERSSLWQRAKSVGGFLYNNSAGEIVRNKGEILDNLTSGEEYDKKMAFSRFLSETTDITQPFNTQQYLNGLEKLEGFNTKLANATLTAGIENQKLLIDQVAQDATDFIAGTVFTNPQLLGTLISVLFTVGTTVVLKPIVFLLKKLFISSKDSKQSDDKNDEKFNQLFEKFDKLGDILVEQASNLKSNSHENFKDAKANHVAAKESGDIGEIAKTSNRVREAMDDLKWDLGITSALQTAYNEAEEELKKAKEKIDNGIDNGEIIVDNYDENNYDKDFEDFNNPLIPIPFSPRYRQPKKRKRTPYYVALEEDVEEFQPSSKRIYSANTAFQPKNFPPARIPFIPRAPAEIPQPRRYIPLPVIPEAPAEIPQLRRYIPKAPPIPQPFPNLINSKTINSTKQMARKYTLEQVKQFYNRSKKPETKAKWGKLYRKYLETDTKNLADSLDESINFFKFFSFFNCKTRYVSIIYIFTFRVKFNFFRSFTRRFYWFNFICFNSNDNYSFYK